uniref:MFS domain-containing protein n=1 Tax=Mesocestoides corti TaxID=53468 RepID=A0A5K3FR96_MESCO
MHFFRLGMLLSLGILVVGPYSLITTVVSADLGTDQSLQGNTKALSTVVAIIDGMGSLGAAAGPFIVGLIVGYGWLYIFLVMMLFLILSILFLLRRIVKELQTVCRPTVAYVQMP